MAQEGKPGLGENRPGIDLTREPIWMMARLLVAALVIAGLSLGGPVMASAAGQPPLFASEDAAKQACPHDIVVWLNTKSGIYHYKGQKWYAATTVGAYVCKAEADQAGDIPGDLPIPGQQ